MDELQNCAQIFSQMLNKDYYLTLEDDTTLHLYFLKRHFKHLLGLHKLKDLAVFRPRSAVSANRIFEMALHGELSMQLLRKSPFFPQIKDRIRLFPSIESLFSKRIIVNFNPALVDSCKLQAEYILYTQQEDGYLHLAIGHAVTGEYPESFFFERTNYYLSDQIFMDVKKLEIIDRSAKRQKRPSAL